MSAQHFDNNNFEEKALKAPIAVVDFFATWCGPCQMLAPILDKLADEYEGKIVIGKVDVDESRELAMKYEVSSIPCVVAFKEGKEVDRKVGFPGEAGMKDWFEELIK